MPPVNEAQLQRAVSVLNHVKEGARASAELGRVIAQDQLGPGQSEQLAGLIYGALRRERRILAALDEQLAGPAPRLLALGAGLIDGLLDLSVARELAPELDWPRFRRSDDALLERSRGVEKVALLGSLPDFLAELLSAEYGDEAASLAASLSEPAPRALRVNALRADVQEATARLAREGARTEPGRWGARALVLTGAFNPFVTRAFHEGLFELQDEGSQLACELVAPPPRGLVVDACAGAGGKSLALAAALEGRGKVVSLDVDAQKLAELRRRAKRAGAANVQALHIAESGDFPEEVAALSGKAERLLVDAPCSGTGVLRRNPEARARLTPAALQRLVETQRTIVERALPLLAPGGRLVFVTCSLLRAEGESLLGSVAEAHPELAPVNLAEIYDRAYVERFRRGAPHELRLLPHLHGTDGFFVGVLRKKR
jgi:16S rRNA (cytosine967-C5)-methyltransferase